MQVREKKLNAMSYCNQVEMSGGTITFTFLLSLYNEQGSKSF